MSVDLVNGVGEDEDVQLIDAEPEPRDVATPRGHRSSEERSHTGYTPDPKRSRLEGEEEGNGNRVETGTQGSQSSTYQGSPIAPPPGISMPGAQPSTPENPGNPNPPLTLQDLFSQIHTGFEKVGTQIQQVRGDLNQDLGKLRTEQRETKDIATKALTVADSTQKELQQLTKRVNTIEQKGVGKGNPTTGGQRQQQGDTNGYNTLGGENGTDMIVGEFDQYASREERKENWAIIKRVLPEEVLTKIAKEEAPGLKNRIMIISIKPSPEGPAKTREDLLGICRLIKQGPTPLQRHRRQYQRGLRKSHKTSGSATKRCPGNVEGRHS